MSSNSSKPSASNDDKYNLWWKAFRETILDVHSIYILQKPNLSKLPRKFFEILDKHCQNLHQHQWQAKAFENAVAAGKGLASAEVFPSELMPILRTGSIMTRCSEPEFDRCVIPRRQKRNLTSARYEIPIPRPGLACGFSSKAFSAQELANLPTWLASDSTFYTETMRKTQMDQTVYCPFFIFNYSDSPSKDDVQTSLNNCAVDGSSALRAISMLYDIAWPEDRKGSISSPSLFSCTIHDELAIINHHWMEDEGGFSLAPLCRFELSNNDHTMQFLAWFQAIEEWAENCLLPDLQKALNKIINQSSKEETSKTDSMVTVIVDAEDEVKMMDPMKSPLPAVPVQPQVTRVNSTSVTGRTPLSITGRMRAATPTQVTPKTSSEDMPWSDLHPALRQNKAKANNESSPTTSAAAPVSPPSSAESGVQRSLSSASQNSQSSQSSQKSQKSRPARRPRKRSAKAPSLETIIAESPDIDRTFEQVMVPSKTTDKNAEVTSIASHSTGDSECIHIVRCESPTTGVFDTSVIQNPQTSNSTPDVTTAESSKMTPDDSSVSTLRTSLEEFVHPRAVEKVSFESRTACSDMTSIITKSDKAAEKPKPRVAPAKKKRRFSCPIQNYIAERKKRRLRQSISFPMDEIPEPPTFKAKVNQGISNIVERSKPKRNKVNKPTSNVVQCAEFDSQSTLAASVQSADAIISEKEAFDMEPPPTATLPEITNAWIDHVLSDRMVCSDDCSDHSDGEWHSDEELSVPNLSKFKRQSLAFRNQERNMSSPALCVQPLHYGAIMI